MSRPRLRETVVFHQAALGDLILCWPLLRTLGPTTLITKGGPGRLSARFLTNVHAEEIEQARWNVLWRGRLGVNGPSVEREVRRVISFVADRESAWAEGARERFPEAVFEFRPTQPPPALPLEQVPQLVQSNAIGAVVFHVGSGGLAKRWEIGTSLEFVQCWRTDPRTRAVFLIPLAGPVEAELMTQAERIAFESASGEVTEDLDRLADVLVSARLFIGFDSGPAHLSAQIGLPTICLFGPTDPDVWCPRGAAVHVLRPSSAVLNMAWLRPVDALARIIGLGWVDRNWM